jgi:CheY-like chemotaxis protein
MRDRISPQPVQEVSMQSSEQHHVLIVSPMAEVSQVAESLSAALGCPVRVANGLRAGVAELRRRPYSVVVVDDCMAETNPAATEMLWQSLGMAVPVQINFAFHSGGRLAREIKAALGRCEQQQVMAMRAAASLLENELKSTVTGLLLQSQLALAEPALPPKVTVKLELVAELAGTLRRRLEHAQA